MGKETMKITLNLSVELVKRIEEYANSLNINRTSAMSVLMSQALEYKNAVGMMSDMGGILLKLEELNRLASKGN